MSLMEDILELIKDERGRQDEKWGEQNHEPLKWLAILGEEVGEANKAVLDKDMDNLKEELIQVSATALAFIECLERNKS
tara:strand:+ start:17249 stop:17485 length:237 start_codon:yes stop_codon:yes gene_type:complete